MAGADAVPEVANWISSAAIGIGLAIGAAVSYLKRQKEPTSSKDVAVVSASLFSDKQVIMDLIAGLRGVERTLERTNELLEADAQRRHDEHIIREALAKRGITD
ncbi:MAG TPA: hypothetical protein VMQ93_08765 [Novosphingobium sp.]|nr:hypothetical protein [Novosphingobium sp.]